MIGIEDPDLNPHLYSHPIFDKGFTNTHWRKAMFNKWLWSTWIPAGRRMKPNTYLSSHKTQLQKDPGPQHETGYPESDTEENREYVGTHRPRKELSEQQSYSTSIKSNNGQTGIHETKKLLSSKGHHHSSEGVTYRTGKNLYKVHL